ncbi:MAG: tetratricopeptide repeat protein [Polyangiaceae bacterium]|nr:tetratricopeptide repeat protein [Polyangiaceae bacterium]
MTTSRFSFLCQLTTILGLLTLGAPFAPALAQENAAASPATEPQSPAPESAPQNEDSAAEKADAVEEEKKEEVDPYAEAKLRVATAQKLYADGNYDAAFAEFQRAYEEMAGHPARPMVLFNLGLCEEKLYRYDAAIASYRKYLELSPNAEDAPTVSAKIELPEGLLGMIELSVTTKKDAPLGAWTVWIDGRKVGTELQKISIPSGTHEIEIQAPGFENEKQQVQLSARDKKKISFELSPLASEYKGLPKGYFWGAAGAAATSAAVGGVFGILALSKSQSTKSRAESADPSIALQVNQEDKDKIDNLALAADICFVTAGVFTVGAVVLGVMTDWSGDSETAAPESAGIQYFDVTTLPGGGFMRVGGTF